MVDSNLSISITLLVTNQNTTLKGKLSDWIRRNNSTIDCQCKVHFKANNKVLISKYMNSSCNSMPKETNNPKKKGTEELNRHFSKDIQVAKKDMKRYSTSLIFREMKIKTTIRHQSEQQSSKCLQTTSVGEDEKRESHWTAGKNEK